MLGINAAGCAWCWLCRCVCCRRCVSSFLFTLDSPHKHKHMTTDAEIGSSQQRQRESLDACHPFNPLAVFVAPIAERTIPTRTEWEEMRIIITHQSYSIRIAGRILDRRSPRCLRWNGCSIKVMRFMCREICAANLAISQTYVTEWSN